MNYTVIGRTVCIVGGAGGSGSVTMTDLQNAKPGSVVRVRDPRDVQVITGIAEARLGTTAERERPTTCDGCGAPLAWHECECSYCRRARA